MIVKIYGLPRSCTNLTEVLVKRNFKMRFFTNYPDWKHGFSTIKGTELKTDRVDTTDLKFIICTKHPYTWLWSLHTFEMNEHKVKKTPMEFLKNHSWHYNHMLMSGIDAFNQLTKHWIGLSNNPKNLQVVQQENMVKEEDQLQFLQRIEENFGPKRKVKQLVPIEKIIRPGAKSSAKGYKARTHEFGDKEIKYINSKLDPAVVKLAGYTL